MGGAKKADVAKGAIYHHRAVAAVFYRSNVRLSRRKIAAVALVAENAGAGHAPAALQIQCQGMAVLLDGGAISRESISVSRRVNCSTCS